MRSDRLLALLMCVGVGCVAGAPPGFSDGDMWAVPLVGPLENGPVVVPVKINGNGPYLFMVDPDSPVSSVDTALVSGLNLYSYQGGEALAENDTSQPLFLAEVKEMQVGDLVVSNKTLRVHKAGTFWFGGRELHGLLGRDVVADSLIVAVDRDRGMMYLGTQGNLPPPDRATEVEARLYNGRYIVPATLNEAQKLALHVDLGAPFTMIWPSKMKDARLPRLRVRTTLHDELGIARQIETASMAAKLSVGGEVVSGLMLLPFADARLRERDLDGALGQNFLSKYRVTINWHQKSVWLADRAQTLVEMAQERMRRWGPAMDKCEAAACVTVVKRGVPAPEAEMPEAETPEAEVSAAAPPEPEAQAEADDDLETAPATGSDVQAPAETGVEAAAETEAVAATDPPPPAVEPAVAPHLEIVREDWTRDFAYEVLIEAVDEQGQPFGLPLLRVTFPEGATVVTADEGMEPYFVAAGFRAVDMSPFPRDCDNTASGLECVWPLPSIH